MLHNFYNDIFDKIEFFGNCSFDGCKPSTVFLIICRCINGLFRYMFVNYVSIKKKKKKRKNPLDWEQLMYYTTVCPLIALNRAGSGNNK